LQFLKSVKTYGSYCTTKKIRKIYLFIVILIYLDSWQLDYLDSIMRNFWTKLWDTILRLNDISSMVERIKNNHHQTLSKHFKTFISVNYYLLFLDNKLLQLHYLRLHEVINPNLRYYVKITNPPISQPLNNMKAILW